jgi:hypothetical protein
MGREDGKRPRRSARRPAPLTLAGERQRLSLFGKTNTVGRRCPSFVGLRLGEEPPMRDPGCRESRVSGGLAVTASVGLKEPHIDQGSRRAEE